MPSTVGVEVDTIIRDAECETWNNDTGSDWRWENDVHTDSDESFDPVR